MAVIPKISLTPSKNGKIITLTDTTGVYDNPDNLGGYGTPNLDSGDVVKTHISVYKYKTGETESIVLSGTDFPPFDKLTYDITSILVDETTEEETLEDSVYKVTYCPLWEAPETEGDAEEGSAIITIGADITTFLDDNEPAYILIGEVLYTISSYEFTGGNTEITLGKDFEEATDTYDILFGYCAENTTIVFKTVDECWNNKVTDVKTCDVDCGNTKGKKKVLKVMKIFSLIQGAINSWRCEKYEAAQEKLDAANILCSDKCSDC